MDDDQRLLQWRYERLVWALRWLAAEPEAALSAEPRDDPDEIALSLEDVLALGPLTGVVGSLPSAWSFSLVLVSRAGISLAIELAKTAGRPRAVLDGFVVMR